MSTQNAIITERAARLGSVNARLQGMYSDETYSPSIAIGFTTDHLCELSVEFHANTDQWRAFALELLRHADVTDAAQEAAGVPAF